MGEMPRKLPRAAWLVALVAGALYIYRLGAAGLVGPDEPRYAAIGREMARSGDWITPRLWGQPWFEKPALLYWMEAVAFRLGLGPELAPRLPVAILAAAFLAFFWWILQREFGNRPAWMATLILGTSGAWMVASQLGVTDLPLAATFSAAMLLTLPWIGRRETAPLPLAAALMGLAVLAKGLVPVALAFPLFWRKAAWRDLLRPRVALPFLVVSLPWYALCWWRNGREFLVGFFWRQHVERMVSGALLHVQPWWFYLPMLLASLLPWTPLLALLGRRTAYRDPRRLFLLAWLLFGLAFFSLAPNKLPGYLLPLLPAAAALMGLALEEARRGARLARALGRPAGGLPHGCPGSFQRPLPRAFRARPARYSNGPGSSRPAWGRLSGCSNRIRAVWPRSWRSPPAQPREPSISSTPPRRHWTARLRRVRYGAKWMAGPPSRASSRSIATGATG